MSSGTAVATDVVRRLVELACLAPSVHNTQPWSWRVADDRLELWADRSRALPVEDPTGRNLLISCGTALHHFRVAARAMALDVEADVLPDGPDGDLLAAMRLTAGRPSPSSNDDLEVLRTRCTDRRRFTRWPIPLTQLEELCDEARAWECQALPVTDLQARFRIELLTNRAHELRDHDLTAVVEQRSWIGERTGDGIPPAALPAREAGGRPGTRFEAGASVERGAGIESSDGVIVLGGESDGPAYWLRTGQGLSALWLLAARTGLSVVPLSLPIEVDSVRPDVERVIDGIFAPHLLVRIGWQAIGRSGLPRTPRRPVTDVLST